MTLIFVNTRSQAELVFAELWRVNDDGLPIIWLQDISGFDIGLEAEKHGLLGYGSNLLYTNSTNEVPMISITSQLRVSCCAALSVS